MRVCEDCGQQLQHGAAFCSNCGAGVGEGVSGRPPVAARLLKAGPAIPLLLALIVAIAATWWAVTHDGGSAPPAAGSSSVLPAVDPIPPPAAVSDAAAAELRAAIEAMP